MPLIALDDGHGINTAGKRTPFIKSIGRAYRENEFNRAVVGYLDIELKRCGFQTVMTAPGDADAPLKARTDKANRAKADLFVSVHYNAIDGKFDGPGKDPQGVAVYIWPGSTKGRSIGEKVLKELLRLTGQKQYGKGVIEQNFHVLRESNMPAILTESGFMDNEKEALLMITPEYQRIVAEAHARGICAYFGKKYVPAPSAAVPVAVVVEKSNGTKTESKGRPLNPDVAESIIKSFLSPGWFAQKAAGNKDSADWIHHMAQELRGAAGLPKQ